MSELTPKQESFCHRYMETGSASEAYRLSYDSAEMKPESIHRSAKELMDNPKIASRIKCMREETQLRHKITLDTLLAELEEVRHIAVSCETPQSAAAVGAIMGKAKLLGLDKQLVEVTGANGGPLRSEAVVKVDEATLASLIERL